MKGNNTLTLNAATMIEAVQLLLDRDAPSAGKVTSVKAATSGSYESPLFTVEVSQPEPQP